MTTNSPNPVDGDVQALTGDYAAYLAERLPTRIKSLEIHERNGTLSSSQKETLHAFRCALAALTAEPALWSYWFNDETHYQEARFGKPQLKNGKYIRETYYTAPPAQLLRPVELPDGFAPSVIRHGLQSTRHKAIMTGNGDWIHKDQAIEAIRAAGYEVKND